MGSYINGINNNRYSASTDRTVDRSESSSSLASTPAPDEMPREFSGNLKEDIEALSASQDIDSDTLDYVQFLFRQPLSYRDIEEDSQAIFREAITNENNKIILKNQLIVQVSRLKDFETITPTDEKLSKRRILKIAENIKNNFFINLEEAFLRQRRENGAVRDILAKSNCLDPNLQRIELARGGDPHNGGKQVCILHYINHSLDRTGSIVYKPRDMRVEASIINDETNSFNNEKSVFSAANVLLGEMLPTYRIKTCSDEYGHFGFAEFIQQAFCLSGVTAEEREAHDEVMISQGLSGAEVKEFYRRVGVLQLVSQLLGITDLNASNIVVSKKPGEGYFLYPIDLETSYDIRVLTRGYPTGIIEGLGLRITADNNFIVVQRGNSPRGHRLTKADKRNIATGFKYAKARLNVKSFKSQLLRISESMRDYQHRYVPIPTADLNHVLRSLDRHYRRSTHGDHHSSIGTDENAFLDLVSEKIDQDISLYGGRSFVQQEAKAVLAAYKRDKMNHDTPIFLINNLDGSVTYSGVHIAQLGSAYLSLIQAMNDLENLQIESLFL